VEDVRRRLPLDILLLPVEYNLPVQRIQLGSHPFAPATHCVTNLALHRTPVRVDQALDGLITDCPLEGLDVRRAWRNRRALYPLKRGSQRGRLMVGRPILDLLARKHPLVWLFLPVIWHSFAHRSLLAP
jgi:hypothetical protein